MLQDQITKLIPFIGSYFLEYPLWEEGNWTPAITFWQKTDDIKKLQESLEEYFGETGYFADALPNPDETLETVDVLLYPIWDTLKDGTIEYALEDWSIEEMVDLLGDYLNPDEENEDN